MPGPLLPTLGPLVAALIIFLVLRRWPAASAIAGSAGAFLLGLATAAIPLQPADAGAATALIAGDEIIFLGRSLLLAEGVRQILVVAFFAAAILFLLSTLWPQGPDFVPAGLLALSPLAFAVMIQPFTFGAVALLVAAGPLAVMIQGHRPASTLPALRFLQFTALTIPAFLISGWMLHSQQFVLAAAIWRLLLLALVMLLAGLPFHLWVRPLVKEAPPLVIVFVLGLGQLLFMTFGWGLLQQFPGVLQTARFTTLLAWSGAGTSLLAALLALGAGDERRLLAALVLTDIGATLMILSLGTPGMAHIWLLLLSRILSLLVAAVGLSLLAPHTAIRFAGLKDALRPKPYGIILFAFGASSLIGLPFTPGFPARWATTRLLAQESVLLAVPLLLAVAAGTFGILRSLLRFTEGVSQPPEGRPADGLPAKAILALALPAGILLILSSWPLLTFAARLAEQF